MRKTILPQSVLQHDELIINYKQDDITKIDTFLPIWSQVWNKFQNDLCSYIVPLNHSFSGQSIIATEEQERRDKLSNVNQSKLPKHSFSFPYWARQLKRVIILHSSMDVFSEIKKEITKVFYRIANYFVNVSLKNNSNDLFQCLVNQYRKLSPKLNIVIGCLNLIICKFITRRGLQDQFYSILYKQLINHQNYELFVNNCISEIQNMRDFCLKINSVKPNEKNILCPSQNNPIIESLKILNNLKIFPYVQYLQRSKKYYASILVKLPKNIWMFPALSTLVKFQKMLQNVIIPEQQQLELAKKILKISPWRATQDEAMLKIFCKEVLDQIYDDMIEYVEFLIDFEPHTNKNIKDEHKQFVVNMEEKKQLLRYLWFLAKILQKYFKMQRSKHQNIKGGLSIDKRCYQKKSPMTKLLDRVLMVIIDIKKFINPQPNSQLIGNNHLYKIISFRNHILSVIYQCFDNDFKYLNMINSKIEQVIMEESQIYNQKLCSIILSPSYRFPRVSLEDNKKANNLDLEMVDQNEELNTEINNRFSFELFRLAPSKDQFMRNFQQEFSNYVIPYNKNKIELSEQQLFIHPLQKQVGHIYSKTIQRMLNDIWRNGQMIYHKNQKIVCRILCHDWPSFNQPKFKLPDILLQIRGEFQSWFLSQPNNDKKKLKWIEQCGSITMRISGIQSVFSELEASIIMLLSKSYRPIKAQQFKQVLEYTQNDMLGVISNLVQMNVLIYNSGAGNYQLNYQNTIPYYSYKKSKLMTKSQKKIQVEKDYSSVIEALIARILKRRKSVQKTDLAKLLSVEVMVDNYHPGMEEINNALQKLRDRDIVNIDKTRGIIKYLE